MYAANTHSRFVELCESLERHKMKSESKVIACA
jgi:hypothetical protein